MPLTICCGDWCTCSGRKSNRRRTYGESESDFYVITAVGSDATRCRMLQQFRTRIPASSWPSSPIAFRRDRLFRRRKSRHAGRPPIENRARAASDRVADWIDRRATYTLTYDCDKWDKMEWPFGGYLELEWSGFKELYFKTCNKLEQAVLPCRCVTDEKTLLLLPVIMKSNHKRSIPLELGIARMSTWNEYIVGRLKEPCAHLGDVQFRGGRQLQSRVRNSGGRQIHVGNN